MKRNSINRRLLIIASAAALPLTRVWAGDELLPATPSDVEGPFYPVDIPEDSDNDLTRVVGKNQNSLGQYTYVHGQVMDRSGVRIDGARVEIWQCDHTGVYHHPNAPGSPDVNFQGFGAMVTNRDGHYHFRTLRPVPYEGRTPHIHFRVSAEGLERLTTQLYVAEEAPQNSRDSLYNRHNEAEQALVTTSFTPIANRQDGLLEAEFNIVLA